MKRGKPINEIDVIGPLCIPLEHCIEHAREAKKTAKLCIKPPNNNAIIDDIECLDIHADQEHQAMLKQQRLLKERQEKQRAVNANKIEELYRNCDKLRSDFIQMNNYLKECDDKKTHATNVITRQTMLHKSIKQESNELKGNIEEMTMFRNKLVKLVKEMEPYERVIQEYINKHKSIHSIDDCMQRCDAIMIAQDEISTMKRNTFKNIVASHKRMAQKVNEAKLILMAVNTVFNESVRSLSKAQYQCYRWEKKLKECKDALIEKDLEGSRIIASIRDTYSLLCKFNHTDPDQTLSLEEQMAFIRSEILIYEEVLKQCETEIHKKSTVR